LFASLNSVGLDVIFTAHTGDLNEVEFVSRDVE
jgi:hypothetical protein